jgi:sec-independent protein translocase protein TatB
MLSIPHMIVVFVVVLVLFGPQKLPELARGLGKLMAEFRKASTDFRSAFEEEMRDLERQALLAERKKAAEAAAAGTAAQPNQQAALATPESSETGSAGTETAAAVVTEAPSVSPPVSETIPRSSEESSEIKSEETIAAAGAPESQQNPQHSA